MIEELSLGQIPEAIYFALFLIFTKGLKEKRLLFIILMIIQAILLRIFLPYDILYQVDNVFITYTLLKILYKEKAQITDIFTFMIGSLIMLIINMPVYLIVLLTCKKFVVFAIVARILLFIFLILFKNKLYKIQKIYKKIWNRNDKVKKKIKTTTFRSINLVLFNIMFYLVNIILLFQITKNGGV